MELPCPLGIRALSGNENLSCFGVLSHIINPLLTKLVRSTWLDIGLIDFGLGLTDWGLIDLGAKRPDTSCVCNCDDQS